ncbi:subtilisin-like protease SBT3 [Aristolochia californica]|uniref:subtilisin-like protease SBT3 n=1 Tax=Aristolochia californica TaxID=171875 RepID=UPI0035DC3870
MASLMPSFLLLIFMAAGTVKLVSAVEGRHPYIIHMDSSVMPSPFATHDHWYSSLLSSLSLPDGGGLPPTHLYTYNHVLHGFSAVLSDSQLRQLESLPGHVATMPESYGKLHTTHTPRFLGLNRRGGIWPAANFGDDVIIGIIDTGIWPESESFDDRYMPPVPARWRGQCETGTAFNASNCNKKLIGARSFSKGLKHQFNISTEYDYDSPRDFFGHGTHTSSTAAGSPVRCANYFGYAKGTAVGMAPMARVAMYKTVFYDDTFETAATDVLAGMDQAIADGVDVMSLSLGFFDSPYFGDIMAMGAFAALEKGIFVACSAGNAGPHGYTIINGAPWITTVGAATIDRDYGAVLTFGNDTWTIQGKSAYPESLFIRRLPLYFASGNATTERCEYGSLDRNDVAGKIVFCTSGDIYGQIDEVNRTGARAAIFATDSIDFFQPTDFSFPFVAISLEDGAGVYDYLGMYPTTGTVDIEFKKTILGKKSAPQVAYFSSRGPNKPSPWILKPDIVGPGVQILAAWVPNKGFVPLGNDYLVTDYNIISGTSMSCPHVAGIAALIKAVHPDWTPASIRSAMMTTAYVIDNTYGPILDMTTGTSATPLDFGGGHVDPNKAMDPGLVYDIELQDYVDFLCGLNYTATQIRMVTRSSNYSCRTANLDLNYPSFVVVLNNTNSSVTTFSRTLTNVGENSTVYRAVVKAPTGMEIVVFPATLTFAGKYSKMNFAVSVRTDLTSAGARITSDYIGNYGYLSWYEVGGKHVVRSPIVSVLAP